MAESGLNEGTQLSKTGSVFRDLAFLLSANALTYAAVVPFGYFASDDFTLRGFYDPAGGVNWRTLRDALLCESTTGYFYRPLPILSVALDYLLWGANPMGYFLTNLGIHGLIGILIWATARELGWKRWPAMVSGLATILHPVHVETLWWVAGRFDLLASLFSALTLWIYVRWLHRGKRHLGTVVVAGYMLAVFSKEAAIALPLVLAATFLVSAGSRPAIRWTRHAGFFLSLIIVAASLFIARRLCLGLWVGPYPGGAAPADPVAVLRGIPKLLLFLFFPAPLPGTPGTPPWLLIAAGVSACVLIAVLISRGERRFALWAGAATFLLALPVLALVGVIQRPTDGGRIFLLPTIGFGFLIGNWAGTRRGRLAHLQIGALFLAWMALLAHYQQPWIARAGTSRSILAQIETAARAPDVSQVMIVGLPDYFGQGNWALPLAASRPFIDVPEHVSVKVAARTPAAARSECSSGTLAGALWSCGRSHDAPLDDPARAGPPHAGEGQMASPASERKVILRWNPRTRRA